MKEKIEMKKKSRRIGKIIEEEKYDFINRENLAYNLLLNTFYIMITVLY